VALVVLVLGTLAAAAIDVRSRRIPNALTGGLGIAAIALHLSGGVTAVLLAFAAMIVAFALGSLAFSAGWLGGGDVKLIAVACGLVGLPGSVPLVLCIVIAGAFVAIAQAAYQRRLFAFIRNTSELATHGYASQSLTLLPYGVAIAGGSTAYAFSTLVPALRLAL
jgi:prepilin peptidase CpaA